MPVFRESASKGATVVHLDLPLSNLIEVASPREPLICYPLYFKIFHQGMFSHSMLIYISIYSNIHKHIYIYILYIHISIYITLYYI